MTARSTATAGLFALLLSVFLAPPASAQDLDQGAHSGWELAPFVGGYDDSPEFGPGKNALFVDPAKNLLYGGRFGRAFSSGLFVQGSVGTVTLQLNDAPGTATNQRRDLGVWMYEALAGYNVRLLPRLALFGTVGAGASRWNPRGLPSETDFTLSYGAGARIFLTPRLALRGDVRVHQVPSALGGTKDAVGAGGGSQTFWGWASTGGLSFFLGGGGPKDSDGDGVRDPVDACPGTPAGARVDARGCELDGDGDGVVDRLDRCPNTPAGAIVDQQGCAGDDDGDGVVNGVDQCPSTVSGARVDARGCATDGDGDGVPDGIDRCPNTAAGAAVDDTGCPRQPAERQLEERGRFTIDANVTFGFDSAELRSPADSVLDDVGQALVRNPDMRVRIEGYTDSVGIAAYNRSLSLRRARAVRDYLVEHFPQLNASRFDVVGYGETRPVADNGTAEGRRRNRRVDFVVLGRGDVQRP